jgi:hypothetical protein
LIITGILSSGKTGRKKGRKLGNIMRREHPGRKNIKKKMLNMRFCAVLRLYSRVRLWYSYGAGISG